jgi:hypothetical protein
MRRFTFACLALLGGSLAAGAAYAAPPETATVTFDPDKASTARLTQATMEAGFPSKLIIKP